MKQDEIIKKAFEYSRKNLERSFTVAGGFYEKAGEYTEKVFAHIALETGRNKELLNSWAEEIGRVNKEVQEAVLTGHENLMGLFVKA